MATARQVETSGSVAESARAAFEDGDLRGALIEVVAAEESGEDPAVLVVLLGEIATGLRLAGLRESAAQALAHMRAIQPGPIATMLAAAWGQEWSSEGWRMSRGNPERSSEVSDLDFGRYFSLRHLWTNGDVSSLGFAVSPSPIVAGDLLALYDRRVGAWIGLDLLDGHISWRSELTGGGIARAASAAYAAPWLYTCQSEAISRVRLWDSGKRAGFETCFAFGGVTRPSEWGTPLSSREGVTFPVEGGIVRVHPESSEAQFVRLDLGQNEFVLDPVAGAEAIYALTSMGRLFSVRAGDPPKCLSDGLVDGTVACSSPCLIGDRLVFEVILEGGSRHICAHDPCSGDTLCSILDGEFRHSDPRCGWPPPLAWNGSAIVFSELRPAMYIVSLRSGSLSVAEVELERKCRAEYSAVVGANVVSAVKGGCVSVDLDRCDCDFQAFLQGNWTVAAQPVIRDRRIMFVCEEGVMCYEME